MGTAYTPPRKTVEPRSACGLITQSIYVPKASCQLNNDGKSDCRLRRIFFWYSSIVTCNTGLCRNVLKGRKTLIFSIKNLPVLGLVDMASNDDGVRTTVTTRCYPPLFQRSPARRTPPRSCAGNRWEVPTDLEGKLKSSEFTWIRLVLSSTGYSDMRLQTCPQCGWLEVRESCHASGLVRIPKVLFVTSFFVSRLYISL